MRTAVIQSVHEIMVKDKNVYFLTGDLGYNAVECIERDFSGRFLNVGLAEQNMIGVAAGIAMTGKTVFVYSIIPFLTMRCYEQIRDDVCYHNLNVKLIGAGAGLSYGVLGSTHFALEDIAIMRCLPNMTVVSPADPNEAGLATKAIHKHNGPVYLRTGKRGEPEVHKIPYQFKLGKPDVLVKGNDIVIFATGGLVFNTIQAAKTLKEKYAVDTTVVNIHTIKPLDKAAVMNLCKNKKAVFSVEEHSIVGGLGSTLAEIISQEKNMPSFKMIGTDGRFVKYIGTQEYLRKKVGLDKEGIARFIIQFLKS